MNIVRCKRFGVSALFVLLFSLLAIVLSHNSAYASNGELKVHYIDVGQADSILVDLPNDEIMLIDGGRYAKQGSAGTAADYLKQQGITNIDYMVNTHPHTDHVGGLLKIIEDDTFNVKNIYMTKATDGVPKFIAFTELLDTRRIEPIEVMAGSVLIDTTVGDKKLTVKCIAPFNLVTDNTNNNSIVLKLEYGDISYLFMADAEEAEEKAILSSNEDIKCDVYKVGHHGANTSSTQELIDAAKPKAVVITADESEGSTGLPAEGVLARYQKAGAKIYRTDLLDTIVSYSDGKSFSMDKEPKAEIYLPAGTISIPENSYTYTGSGIKPKVTIDLGGVELKEGVDFYCTYQNNINVGNATFTCIGKGDYYGTKTKKFKIVKKVISKAAHLHVADQVYTGAKLYPSVVIKDGGKKLKLNKDYTVSYTKSTFIGEGIVTVNGMGNYSGSEKIYFTIKPKKTSIVLKKSLSDGKLMLQWGNISSVDGYQIFYSENKTDFKKFKTVKGGNVTSLKKKLTVGKKYYFYIRSYKVVDGKKVFSGNSAIFAMKHKTDINNCKISKIKKKLKYNGKARTQKIVVKLGKTKLIEGKDYKLKYKNNTQRGTATIKIKGKGWYNSYIKKTFRIV